MSFGTEPLFNDFSFSVPAGEHIALTGPSGSGKSTMLRCLLGFTEPDSGDILINGKILSVKSVWNIRSQMAYVPQEPDLGKGTTLDFLERPFKYSANKLKSDNLDQLHCYIHSLGLDKKLLSSDIGSLSGGEKQRIALVSALLLDRPILLLDEVASAIDKANTKLVFNLLAGLTDKTIIGVVHHAEGLPFATRRIEMKI